MNSLGESVRRLIHLIAVLYVIVGVMLFAGWLSYRSSHNAELRSVFANCNQIELLKSARREELSDSLGRAHQYKHDHPHGSPAIPLALINEGIASDERSLARFAPHVCKLGAVSEDVSVTTPAATTTTTKASVRPHS